MNRGICWPDRACKPLHRSHWPMQAITLIGVRCSTWNIPITVGVERRSFVRLYPPASSPHAPSWKRGRGGHPHGGFVSPLSLSQRSPLKCGKKLWGGPIRISRKVPLICMFVPRSDGVGVRT